MAKSDLSAGAFVNCGDALSTPAHHPLVTVESLVSFITPPDLLEFALVLRSVRG
jgi:hypothetical protein